MQSVAASASAWASASPSEASTKEVSDIKQELAKLLDDKANMDMSYDG